MPTAANITPPNTRKGVPLWLVYVSAGFAFLLAVGGFIGVMLYVSQGSLHHSTPYKTALSLARQSPCATARLGTPITPGWLIVGSISKTNGEAYADMEFPVRGSLGTGRIHVTGNQTGGNWTIEYLSLRTGDTRTMLLPAAPCP